MNQILIEDQGSYAIENNDLFRMSLLVETTRVQDQIFMKYRLQIYDLERTAQEMKIIEDQDIKDIKQQYKEAIEKSEKELADKHALSVEEKQLLKHIANSDGKLSANCKQGVNMTIVDYQKVIQTIVKFGEELNWLDGKEQENREARRAILAGGNMDEYWECVKK